MTTKPTVESNFGPERGDALPEPKVAQPLRSLIKDHYDTDGALEVFESLLLIAAGVALEGDMRHHPLVMAQAAKALVGLRPDRPSDKLIHLAISFCEGQTSAAADRGRLALDQDQLGLTISVYDLESALAAGDKDEAILQMGRLLMVSDSRAFIFDILLNQAASDVVRAGTLVPFVHSCQRAYDFVGPANLPDFLLPALDAVVVAPSSGGGDAKPLSPWEVLPRLGTGAPELLGLAAHAAQIEADDHVKGPGLSASLRRTLGALAADLPSESPAPSTAGTVDDLLKVARDGDTAAARAISRALAEAGDRIWILDLLEKVGKISAGLLLWADSVRMLLRVAEDSDAGLAGEIAGLQLAGIRPR